MLPIIIVVVAAVVVCRMIKNDYNLLLAGANIIHFSSVLFNNNWKCNNIECYLTLQLSYQSTDLIEAHFSLATIKQIEGQTKIYKKISIYLHIECNPTEIEMYHWSYKVQQANGVRDREKKAKIMHLKKNYE